MDIPKNPCADCDHRHKDKKKQEPCASCPLPGQYNDTLNATLFPTMDFLRKSTPGNLTKDNKNRKEIIEMDEKISERDKLIREHIETICKGHEITIDELRAGVQGKAKTKIAEIRDRIIKSLTVDDFGELTQKEIGDFLNISPQLVSLRLRSMEKKNATAKINKKKVITLDFTKHPEVFSDLEGLAEEKLRTLENQALWMFIQKYEKGVEIA